MIKLTYILSFVLISNCFVMQSQPNEVLNFNPAEISRIEVCMAKTGAQIEMENGFEEYFVKDLNKSKKVSSTTDLLPYRFVMYQKNGKTDTIFSNGVLHNCKGLHESNANLVEMYCTTGVDPIAYQLDIAEQLRAYMDDRNYEMAINLFSKEQQANIRKIQQDNAKFQIWCEAWTFDEGKFKRYKSQITKGSALFIMEGSEWKIDER